MSSKLVTPETSAAAGIHFELQQNEPILASYDTGFGQATVLQGKDSLWIVVKMDGGGGFALRAGYFLGNEVKSAKLIGKQAFEATYSAGKTRVEVTWIPYSSSIRVRTSVLPTRDLILPYVPRDFYLINETGNPSETSGVIHTSQAGLAAPIVFLSLKKPKVGSFLYFQNLTDLNPYFNLTDTTPDGSVGGVWPELGYLPPTSSERPLPGGKSTLLTDSIVIFSRTIPTDPQVRARLFIDLLAEAHQQIGATPTELRDWPGLSLKSIEDVKGAKTASVTHWGCRFVRPYNDAEYPDCMVQANILHGLNDFGLWLGKKVPLEKALQNGMSRFYDRDLKTVRRYLPNVGKDKNRDEVDSWYLYHPLKSLARMAINGEKWAEAMFLDSLETGIHFAKKFKYRWPVMFSLKTGEVIRAQRRDSEPGQTDVAGLYAYVMMQAFELTHERRFLEEAERSIRTTSSMGFELAYQLNNTAWGVPACLKLWKATGEKVYVQQALVFLSAFMRHMIHWESEIKTAQSFSTFMAVLCLDDTRYMALLECHESFEAFSEALTLANEDLPDSARLLMADYGKHALHRAWFYYPKFLPKETLATEIRNGKIDPTLYFPLEDLYPDGQQAGQVGQEVYGCGASFAFTTNAFHKLSGIPFDLFCEYPLRDMKVQGGLISFEITGSPHGECRLALLPTSKKKVKVSLKADDKVFCLAPGDSLQLPGGSLVEIAWS